MKLIEDTKLDFKDVCVVPKPSRAGSRSEVNLSSQYLTLHSKQIIRGIPIIAANMSAVATFEMAKALAANGMFTALHKHYSVEELAQFYNYSNRDVIDHTFYTLGMHDMEKFEHFVDLCRDGFPKLICLDVANGYMQNFHRFIHKVRNICRGSIIMAGNVVTPEGVRIVVDSGADIVKVGIGSSAVCRTRMVAGVGVPQLSAILDCYEMTNKMNALMCSDGGCNSPGDFVKAFGAGADFVMSGTMFAGHEECGGEISDGKMAFYGMSSEAAMNKHHGGMANHRSSEGIHTMVDYKGPVQNTVNHILGGLRSGGSYINALTLAEFAPNTTFVKVNRPYNNIFGE
jgi:GMP reductase